jgi:hypothetical protein
MTVGSGSSEPSFFRILRIASAACAPSAAPALMDSAGKRALRQNWRGPLVTLYDPAVKSIDQSAGRARSGLFITEVHDRRAASQTLHPEILQPRTLGGDVCRRHDHLGGERFVVGVTGPVEAAWSTTVVSRGYSPHWHARRFRLHWRRSGRFQLSDQQPCVGGRS